MGGEELRLGGACGGHGAVHVEVVLRAVDDPQMAQPQREHLIAQHRGGVCAAVHDVQLRQHAWRWSASAGQQLVATCLPPPYSQAVCDNIQRTLSL